MTQDFDREFPDARGPSGKPSWPHDVHKISNVGLDNMGLDREGRLYWKGKMVREPNPLQLTYPQEVSAIVAIVSGVLLALCGDRRSTIVRLRPLFLRRCHTLDDPQEYRQKAAQCRALAADASCATP